MLDPTSRVAVILASAGRPALLSDIVRNCTSQIDSSIRGVVSVPDEDSLPDDRKVLEGWEVLTGTRGLAAQRNAGLRHLDGTADIVLFFDDDAVLRSDYISRAISFFDSHPEVVGLTGRVLADGKLTGEIGPELSADILEESWLDVAESNWRRTRELYGANFGYRMNVAPTLRFDDQLPLYSWLEDHDFARRLMAYGVLADVADCCLVHRAAASGGRSNHRRLGYSQVANAIYLYRKGSFPAWLAIQQIARPLSKNLVLSISGAATFWRRERLIGNALAFRHALKGKVDPQFASEIMGRERVATPPGC